MKKTGSNYVRITILKIKSCNDQHLSSLRLKIEYNGQNSETDKLSGKEIELGKSYFFEVTKDIKSTPIIITAISKTLFVFDSECANISIPFNINKIDDKREWYYLRNSKGENIISILLSLYYDCIEKNISVNDNTFIKSKSDLSCDIIHRNSAKLINKSNISYTDINKSKFYDVKDHMICNMSGNCGSKKNKNLDNTVLYNENYKSPDLSLIGNNLFSPTSCRIDFEKSVFKNIKSEELINTIDIELENKISSFNLERDESRKYNNNSNNLKEDQVMMIKINEEINREKEKIRQKEMIIIKEKEKLENHIKNLKIQKSDFEHKKNLYHIQFNKHQNQVNKLNCEKEIFQYEKKIFININCVMLYSRMIHTNNPNITKSFNNISSTAPVSNCSSINVRSSHKNSTDIKKDMLSDNPFNIQRDNTDIWKNDELIYSHRDKDTRNSTKSLNVINNESYNTISNNDMSTLQKSLNTSNRLYAPIAQIDLRNKKLEVVKYENKLIDSLDNFGLTPSKQNLMNITERKNKMTRTGSDENKKKMNNYRQGTNSTNAKEKKNIKQSNEKNILKVNNVKISALKKSKL